jgi:hypothetical protein
VLAYISAVYPKDVNPERVIDGELPENVRVLVVTLSILPYLIVVDPLMSGG